MQKFTVFFTLILLFLTHNAVAARITTVKKNKALISLDGESASLGTEFFAINPQGKKVAILRVTQVKNGRALAQIVKGSARAGYSLQSRGTRRSSESYYDRKLSQRASTGNSYGIVGGYLMNSMSANFVPYVGASYKATPSMSGSGFGALGFYDYALNSSFVLRGMTGIEQYNVTGSLPTADCSNSTTCSVNLTYLSMYGYGRWNLSSTGYKPWLGMGFGYLYALSKASTFLKSDQISANQILVLAVGMDVRLSAKTYVPVSLEYGNFPSSDSVKAHIIYLRAGYAWNL